MDSVLESILAPPNYCQYASGPCDQGFSLSAEIGTFFIYPSEPDLISNSIELAIEELRKVKPSHPWTSWRNLNIAGKIIFCEICKTARFSSSVLADVTTLNFNVLFEIGYCIGLGLPLLPIRDTTYIQDKKAFDALGILDTLGYFDFQNADELAEHAKGSVESQPLKTGVQQVNKKQPLYVVKSPIDTDGSVKLLSVLKKGELHFRTFDARETARLSLYEAIKQTSTSLGVITYLLNPNRAGAQVHNGRCAFIGGLAMAQKKTVLMLQEGETKHPIDYRDVIQSYQDVEQIPRILKPFFRTTIINLQDFSPLAAQLPTKRLGKIDVGDPAAENEIRLLRSYFVQTGQFIQAKQGRGQLVIGRKGSGKTAIFYQVRDHYFRRKSHLVLDLKPEGHQFTKLRETVLTTMSQGIQEHTMTAFWNYLLLMEIAHKIVYDEFKIAQRDPEIKRRYDPVVEVYGSDITEEQGDFAERLLKLVDSISERARNFDKITKTAEITNLIYARDIRPLENALREYLSMKDGVWLLIDNLDKGWPVKGLSSVDILILRCLMDATRKIQMKWAKSNLEFRSIVFIRNDIFEHLLQETPDKGKDTVIYLDWNDPEVLKEIIRARIESSADISGRFEDIWSAFFDTHVDVEYSFTYMLNRTLSRPREIIRFVRKAIEVAINRNHDRVLEGDILRAEIGYSEDALQDLVFELKDIDPKYSDVPYSFLDCQPRLSYEKVKSLILENIKDRKAVTSAIELLVWFGFLGVMVGEKKLLYSHEVGYRIRRLGITDSTEYVIHPAFRAALECSPD